MRRWVLAVAGGCVMAASAVVGLRVRAVPRPPEFAGSISAYADRADAFATVDVEAWGIAPPGVPILGVARKTITVDYWVPRGTPTAVRGAVVLEGNARLRFFAEDRIPETLWPHGMSMLVAEHPAYHQVDPMAYCAGDSCPPQSPPPASRLPRLHVYVGTPFRPPGITPTAPGPNLVWAGRVWLEGLAYGPWSVRGARTLTVRAPALGFPIKLSPDISLAGRPAELGAPGRWYVPRHAAYAMRFPALWTRDPRYVLRADGPPSAEAGTWRGADGLYVRFDIEDAVAGDMVNVGVALAVAGGSVGAGAVVTAVALPRRRRTASPVSPPPPDDAPLPRARPASVPSSPPSPRRSRVAPGVAAVGALVVAAAAVRRLGRGRRVD